MRKCHVRQINISVKRVEKSKKMIHKTTIGSINVNLVLRHKFEKDKSYNTEMKGWELGLFYIKRRIVGRHGIATPNKWSSKLVNSYTIGIRLLFVKAWIEWNNNGYDL